MSRCVALNNSLNGMLKASAKPFFVKSFSRRKFEVRLSHLPTQVGRQVAVWPDCAIYCTFGNCSKPAATIILPKLPTFISNLCKSVKIFIFLVKSFLATFIDIWQLFTGHTGRQVTYVEKIDKLCLVKWSLHFAV